MQHVDYPALQEEILPSQIHQRNNVFTISFTRETENTKLYLWTIVDS